MKMAIKHKNDDSFVITLTHSNFLGTPELWAIAHENDHKTRKFLVFGHALNHVSGLMIILDRLGTQTLWEITHENGRKTRKRRIFGYNSQTCIGSYGPCEYPWNPKIIG